MQREAEQERERDEVKGLERELCYALRGGKVSPIDERLDVIDDQPLRSSTDKVSFESGQN